MFSAFMEIISRASSTKSASSWST